MMDIRLLVSRGVFLETGSTRIALDPLVLPRAKPQATFISHAHQDHYSTKVLRKLSNIVMSRVTRKIIDPKRRLKNVIEVNPGETIEIDGLVVEAFHSGHIIGSLQFRITLRDAAIVYTGDFNLEKRVVLQPATPLRGDLILIDGTYGHPAYVFPKRREIYERIISRVKEVAGSGEIVLKSRKLGVAQELTALISMSTSLPVIVEPEIARYNEIYEEYGEILGRYAVSEEPRRGAPLITRLSRRLPRNIPAIPVTGWALKTGIPLSSHADFSQLVEYVKRSKAQVVVPVCGFREEFSRYIRENLGVDSYSGKDISIRL
ncbi:MBL fold metallo-hydrolase [Infirmifilum lucidum]|uniref:MBL fold metallo-hydrolase n=1 Tax=Infirmifilum lucidum TaxID=2776706 RepID=A0A7L9FJ80_9CREN|nr:MBL fold metallo-hydrolase [Infirmifilum lucidum]QOJ79711.1 MBL fold metallo-hydrolase [Infirmifilum lucidum]